MPRFPPRTAAIPEAPIGILGGSFDPIHHGHLIVAQLACEQLALAEVRLVVSAAQPLKRGHGASAEHRLAMTRMAVEPVSGLTADDREIRRGGSSYTVDTLQELRAEFPGRELVLLLGADAARELPRWHQYDQVRQLARLVVFPRGEVAPSLEHSGHTLKVPRIEISSTDIRKRAALGMSLSGWVPEQVADYISRLALYRTDEGGAG